MVQQGQPWEWKVSPSGSEVVEDKAGDVNRAFALRDFPATRSVGC